METQQDDIRTWAKSGVAALALRLLALAAGPRRRGQGPSVPLPDAAAAGVRTSRPDAPRAPLTLIWKGRAFVTTIIGSVRIRITMITVTVTPAVVAHH